MFCEYLKFDKHLKNAGGHIGRNVVEITIKMKTIVRKPLMIKIYIQVAETRYLVKQLLTDWKLRVQWGSDYPSTTQMVSHVIMSRWLVYSDALVDVHLWRRASLLCRKYNINKDGNRASGGVSILIRKDIPQYQININTEIQVIVVKTTLQKRTTIHIPPNETKLNKLIEQISEPHLLLSDLNSHNNIWGWQKTNKKTGCPRGVMVKPVDCGTVVSEFVFLRSLSGKYPRERYDPPILPVMG